MTTPLSLDTYENRDVLITPELKVDRATGEAVIVATVVAKPKESWIKTLLRRIGVWRGQLPIPKVIGEERFPDGESYSRWALSRLSN